MARASPLAAFSLLVLVALPLFLADPAAATCSSVVCPRLSDTVCGPCEKAFKKSNAGIDDPCCKTFGCKPDPDMPCCGVTCTSPEDELARCNLFEERSSIANSLLPQYGTSYLRLVRPAKPSKGKCCDKYRCETDFEALCANITANAPCPTSADCGICSTAQVTALPDPESGRCCPTFTCVRDAQCLCDNRTNTDCPVPTCNALEDLVLVEAADPDSNDCCDEYKCEPNNERICEAQNIADGYTGPVCDDCKLPVVTVPARTERLRCQDEWVCVADPTDLCCGFNSSDCAAPPTCGAFEVLERTREIDILEGVCCESFKCVKNYTEVCANIPCEYASAAEYMADRCPNPEGRDWYFVIVKKEADPENGVCCPKYKCRETAEKKVYDLERKSSRRRRRRSSAASVP